MCATQSPIVSRCIDYQCDQCHNGMMRPTNIMLMTDPPKYPHKCNTCGHEQVFSVKYPFISYSTINDNNKPFLLVEL